MLPYTQLGAEQGSELQLHHGVLAPGVAVGNSYTLQHGLHVVVVSLLPASVVTKHISFLLQLTLTFLLSQFCRSFTISLLYAH